MFDQKFGKHIPGYTGYVQVEENLYEVPQEKQHGYHIPGYCGFIPAIKAGNMYGNTYGIITGKCARGEVHTGKFQTISTIFNRYRFNYFREIQNYKQNDNLPPMPCDGKGKQSVQSETNPYEHIPVETKNEFFGEQTGHGQGGEQCQQTTECNKQAEVVKEAFVAKVGMTYAQARAKKC